MICDEPTSALDPVGRKEILSILQQVKEETTVIFSTHVLSDVEKICDHIVLLHEGHIKLDVTPEQFRESYQVNKIQLVLSSQKEMDQLKTRFDVEVIDTHKECFVLSSDIEATQAELYAFLLEKKIYPRKIAIYQPTLEDIFTEVVS